MYHSLEEIVQAARHLGRVTVAIAAAQDREVIEAVRQAMHLDLADAILVGDAAIIHPMLQEAGLSAGTRVIDEPDADQAALKAVELVHSGQAGVLVKGLINSSNFMKAVLNKETGLRSGKILTHMAVFEIPGETKLAFYVDGGLNIAPTLDEKRQILINAVDALHKMGIARPNVAVLAANEQVTPKMPVTLDAKALVDLWQAGEFGDCIVEGPMAMDVAASQDAARHKGISSQISGNVDIFLVPDIEAGNLVGKALMCYARAKMAGVILGATQPIVLVSRSDNAEAKVNSIALACLLAAGHSR